ncbi:hypothetical protein EV643_101658 [Kribbella sp. VKM Ac-2527]|uniref:Pyrroloquinoline-quinone binding quinoprotein n=1 Tax=Kribbella caucasensis TaxID=2512215 RepID=A0A4R6KUT4_9ACTN|nr:DUF6528 family protein [Kribbella sp. VKM Ac-2527]TDO54867.1 hypothetical protein EV643_101658 [Kribbella sp. VKM Ac-2527]
MFKALIGSVGLLALAAGPGVAPATAQAPPNALPSNMATGVEAQDGRLIGLTDQQYENTQAARIRVMDPAVANWNTAAAQKWAWAPTSGNGFAGLASAWGLPSDVKLRKRAGKYVAVVSDTRGLAALISYPAGKRLWAVNVGGSSASPHSVELLPNGNVAVAASGSGGFIRVYTASQGSASAKYVNFPLNFAHGVSWDPARKVLWALGNDQLVALKITGTAAAPKLEKSRVITLPNGGGHDVAPALENHDVFWVSTAETIYRVSKSRGAVLASKDLRSVKSVSSMANGRLIRTRPKQGCRSGWCTDTVEFAGPAGLRTLSGAQIYKARVWSSRYE